MNAVVRKSFDSLEASLATLVESVASYNPSPSAALAIVAADDGLAETLDCRALLLVANIKEGILTDGNSGRAPA
jgi:hypothetical protein